MGLEVVVDNTLQTAREGDMDIMRMWRRSSRI